MKKHIFAALAVMVVMSAASAFAAPCNRPCIRDGKYVIPAWVVNYQNKIKPNVQAYAACHENGWGSDLAGYELTRNDGEYTISVDKCPHGELHPVAKCTGNQAGCFDGLVWSPNRSLPNATWIDKSGRGDNLVITEACDSKVSEAAPVEAAAATPTPATK